MRVTGCFMGVQQATVRSRHSLGTGTSPYLWRLDETCLGVSAEDLAHHADEFQGSEITDPIVDPVGVFA